MTVINNCKHRWVDYGAGNFFVCQLCKKRKDKLTGKILPPDPNLKDFTIS